MNSQGASDEVATKADEIEEHRAGAEGGNESTESESENSSTDGSNLKRENEVADRVREAVIEEYLQTLEERHQHNGPESSQHSETSSTEKEDNFVMNKAGQEAVDNNRLFVEECNNSSAGCERNHSSETHMQGHDHSRNLTDNQFEPRTISTDHDTDQQKTRSTERDRSNGASNGTSAVRNEGQMAARERGKEENTLSGTDIEHLRLHRAVEERADVVDLNASTVHDARVIGAGELVRKWRMDLGLEQHELADRLGCVQTQISCWEINKGFIPLENLREISLMAGRDLEQALREHQPGNQEVSIRWKGTSYDVETFRESIQDPHATLNRSDHPTYYLQLRPIANVEFHRRDIMTTLLETDRVQAIAELTVAWGARANIMKADIERMGIEQGDELRVRILNVRKPEDPAWKSRTPIELSVSDGETRMQLGKKFEGLGFVVRDGDYARMVIQTDGGEALVGGPIKDGAITLNKNIVGDLLAPGEKETSSLAVKMDSIVISPRPLRQEAMLPIRGEGEVQIRGLLSTEGFTLPGRGATLTTDIITDRNEEGENIERLTMRTGIRGTNMEIYPPYSTTEYGTTLQLKLENMVILSPQESETLGETCTRMEKSVIGRELFDALAHHIGADTLYRVERPNQGGIDRIVEKDGRIIIVEEKAEHQYGVKWRATTTIGQVLEYRNRFQELIEQNPNLRERLQLREPDGLEIWTTAKVPKDQNGEIDLSKIQLYEPTLKRNLREGELAMFSIPCVEPDGEYLCKISGVEYSVSVSEKNEVMFSIPVRKLTLNDGKGITVPCNSSLASDRLQIKVKHHDHVHEACENASLFDVQTREDLKQKTLRIEKRLR